MRGALTLLAIAALSASVWFGGRAALDVVKAWLAPILIEDAWRQGRAAGEAPQPWPGADGRPVFRLAAPRLAVERLVLDGASPRALAFGPTVAEDPRATILFGHRDTHFGFLKDVVPGDALVVETVDGGERRYRVLQAAVRDKDRILIAPGRSADPPLVLVTCYPFDDPSYGGPLRYVVLAVPVPAT